MPLSNSVLSRTYATRNGSCYSSTTPNSPSVSICPSWISKPASFKYPRISYDVYYVPVSIYMWSDGPTYVTDNKFWIMRQINFYGWFLRKDAAPKFLDLSSMWSDGTPSINIVSTCTVWLNLIDSVPTVSLNLCTAPTWMRQVSHSCAIIMIFLLLI